ncbi:host-nuclease inhibitor Gam family protein [Leptonema illini]|uniref:Mu-like prophage host-nuclease inhibitor protein Gam n=1 Tax=Leptonema illini DSM 21528 TaxID=929563 RepID=H2CKH3_9LEPT|nr:host-nuclease inhibitor Gam family protein [Leptonema illini]EHQ08278.1 Mu-like prophage host-nuclease inhibitor protein Gam [Leptonema illini DSM 21528]
MAKTKAKAPGIEPAAIHDKLELEKAIKEIGDLQRRKNDIENIYNGRIQELQEQLASEVAPVDQRIQALAKGVKVFADANRSQLIAPDKKSVDLPTGSIAYRAKTAAVATRSTDRLIQSILETADLVGATDRLRSKLRKVFLRLKLELDKEGVLADPESAADFGIEIESGIERFYVKPNTIDTEMEVA